MLDTEVVKDIQNNIFALILCSVKNKDGEYVAGTPEQSFQYMRNGKISSKINNNDKIDIYIMLNENDPEFKLNEKEVLENYNISESCLYDVKNWVKKNRPDIVKKYENQVDMFDLLQIS